SVRCGRADRGAPRAQNGALKAAILHASGYHDHVTFDLAALAGGVPARIEELTAFTDGWLANRRLSPHTRDAYRRDVRAWLDWCRARDLDPMAATFVHVNAFARE